MGITNMNIKELIKDNTVHFLEYRKGYLYYTIKYAYAIQDSTNKVLYKHYKFPIAISDIGDATFKAHDKAILFMRYIKQAMNDNTLSIIKV